MRNKNTGFAYSVNKPIFLFATKNVLSEMLSAVIICWKKTIVKEELFLLCFALLVALRLLLLLLLLLFVVFTFFSFCGHFYIYLNLLLNTFIFLDIIKLKSKRHTFGNKVLVWVPTKQVRLCLHAVIKNVCYNICSISLSFLRRLKLVSSKM